VRIIYLHQYFTTPDRPGATRSYEMARRLVEWGHEVEMVTTFREPTQIRGWYTSEHEGIRVHWLPVAYSNLMSYRDRLKAFARFAVGAARKATSLEGDVVFATSTPLTIALPAVFAARRKRIPMVFEVRDLWPEVPIAVGALQGRVPISAARALERFAYGNSDEVVALSPGMREGVLRSGYPADRVHVIPNGADLALFGVPTAAGREVRNRYPWLGERPLVLYAGTLGYINGVEYLVQVAANALRMAPEVRFLVIGKGPEEAKVRALAADLGVMDRNFFMLPRAPKIEMPALLSAADITLSLVIDLPELWANSANKFFDGLAAGRPIGINHEGWQADLLREENAGLVLDARDTGRATASLLTHIQDRTWVETTGKNARTLAETRFAREMLARKLEDVLYRATARPGRSTSSSMPTAGRA
jgi:glycosyltransferase involved in cell wall biosynthesis